MLAGNWFGKERSASKARRPHRPLTKAPRRKDAGLRRDLRVEELEDRRMLAVFVVNNFGDLDEDDQVVTGSLRQAIELANADDELDQIVFADFLFTDPDTRVTIPGTIVLDDHENGRQLTITEPVQILGPGAQTLTISVGGSNYRIFETNIGPDDELFEVTIGGVTLTGGNLTGTADSDANRGGAILNRENLTLIETEVVNNSASWGGGAVFSPIGTVTSSRSLFVGNSSGGGGGAILLGTDSDEERPFLTVENSTFTQNETFTAGTTDPRPGYGGAIYNRGGRAEISSSTFTGNTSDSGGGGVATNGVDLGDGTGELPPPIPTALSHNVLFGNTTGPAADDVFALRRVVQDEEIVLLAPTLLIDGPGIRDLPVLGYNFIGQIGETVLWDPADENNPGNNHFYQAISTRTGDDEGGITWTLANLYASFGQTRRTADMPPPPVWQGSHLATPALQPENTFVFDNLLQDPNLWTAYQPEDVMLEGEGEEEGETVTPSEQYIGPWIGALNGPAFEWVTDPDEPFGPYRDPPWNPWFTNVANDMVDPVQPNNGMPVVGDPGPFEPFVAYFSQFQSIADTWGDLADEPAGDGETPVAYILEYDEGTNTFATDPLLLPLGFYGGPTRVFYPNSATPSPLIDGGDPSFSSTGIEQRGIHFTRVAFSAIDIGAVEVQNGIFTVDTLFDESDGQYSAAYEQDGAGINPTYTARGDFALREALLFSELNPEFDTINFTSNLLTLEDPTSSPAPTILLKLTSGFDARSAFNVRSSVNIAGPIGFELEIDASGNDFTPTVNNADGTRIFLVDDFIDDFSRQVTISGLTLLGGDVVGEGGAVFNREDLVLNRVSIKENASSFGGAGVTTTDGELIVANSAIFDNFVGFEGGGLKVLEGTETNLSRATVRNSTISGNLASRGGGILNDDGNLLIEFSTISDNVATIGAGIANVNKPNTFTQLNSSIVSANNGTDIQMLQNPPANVQSLGFNLVGSGNALAVFTQPGDLPGVDPLLSPLVYEGGFAPVHRLEAGSPAIDAGESTAVAGVGNVPLYDQRGEPFTRVFDGLQDTKDRIDIGAYELQGTTFIVDSLLDEDDGVISTGNLSLREAVDLANANPFPDVIMFSPSLSGQTIFQQPKNGATLQPGTPTDIRITDSVTIMGLGRNLLTLDGTLAFTDADVFVPIGDPFERSRFFTIDDGDHTNDLQVSISGLTFVGSVNTTQQGAALLSHEDLTLTDVTFTGNSTFGAGNNGGAFYQRYGSLHMEGAILTANTTDGVDADGGAIYIRDADATILNSVITGNSTTQTQGSGGGVYIRGGTLDMTYTTVSSNLAPSGEADGAGIFGNNSTLNINTSYITGNSMTGSNSEGAGIHSLNSTLTLTDSFVSLNGTTGTQSEGAGIYINGGSAVLNRSNISLNTTTGLVSTGGGIAVTNGGELLVQDSTVDRNSTSGNSAHGGGIFNLGGEVTVVDSTVSGNTASGLHSKGGGIYSDTNLGSSEITSIVNSTVSGNSSSTAGGGVYNAGGLTQLRHSTVTNNTVPFFGKAGGVGSLGTSASTTTTVYSTIIAGNFASDDPANPDSDVDAVQGAVQNSFVSLGYNVIGTGLPLGLNAFNNVGDQTGVTDPLLGPLTFNGGDTFTHALMEASAAVNAGNPSDTAGAGSVPMFDQRGVGFPRVLAGRIDVGAVESAFVGADAADFDGDGDIDGQDFLAWQRGYGTPNAMKSDGDANGDGNVDGTDYGIWQSNYGAGLSLAASFAGGSSSGPLAAALQAEGEPSQDATVFTSDELPTGLLPETITLSTSSTDEVVEAESAAENVVVRDRLFAALSSRSDYRDGSASDDVTGESSDEQLEMTVEDQVFESLGA